MLFQIECLSHHSLPLLLAPKKSKLKKLKQRAKHEKQASASKLRCPSCARSTRRRFASCANLISTWPTRSPTATSVFQWSLSLLRRVSHQIGWMGSWVMGKRGSGFWWGFGEVAAARERVAATEDEVLWPCG